MQMDISVMAGVEPRDSQLAVELDTSCLSLDPLIGQQGVGIGELMLQSAAYLRPN